MPAERPMYDPLSAMLQSYATRWLLAIMRKRAQRTIAGSFDVNPSLGLNVHTGTTPWPPVDFTIRFTNRQPVNLYLHRVAVSIDLGPWPLGQFVWEEAMKEADRTGQQAFSQDRPAFDHIDPKFDSGPKDGWFRFTWLPPVQAYAFLRDMWLVRGVAEYRTYWYGIVTKPIRVTGSIDATNLEFAMAAAGRHFEGKVPLTPSPPP